MLREYILALLHTIAAFHHKTGSLLVKDLVVSLPGQIHIVVIEQRMHLRVVGVAESSQSLSYFLIGPLSSCALVRLSEGGNSMKKLQVLFRVDKLGFEIHIHF